jgi:hypothetical protein
MPASVRLAAASAVVASLFATSLPARSADLYEPPRYGTAYDDPRYAEIYGDDPPAYERYAEEEEFEAPYPPHRSFKDEVFERHYDRRHEGRRYAGRGDGCVPRHIARDRLRDDGWRDFHDFDRRGSVVIVQARRRSGRLFDLTIDRCSGEIIAARPLVGGRSYAGAPRRYWQQPY